MDHSKTDFVTVKLHSEQSSIFSSTHPPLSLLIHSMPRTRHVRFEVFQRSSLATWQKENFPKFAPYHKIGFWIHSPQA